MLQFPIRLDPMNCDEQLGKILSVLRPAWPKDQIQRKNFSEGFMNVLFCCHLASDPNLEDGIIFRIPHNVEDPKRYLGATKEEIICNSQVAQAAGSGAPVLAIFKNGLVTKCLPGSAATRKHLREERLIRQIARLLAQLHFVEMDKANILDSEGNPIEISKKVRLFDDLNYIVQHLPEKGEKGSTYPCDAFFTKDNLRKEIHFLKNLINDLDFEVVYSHNDFHCKNLIYDKDSDKMMMIDFDISGYNYEGYDIGALLEDYDFIKYFDLHGVPLSSKEDDTPNMTDTELRLWAKYYLMAKAGIKGKDPNAVTETDIEIFATKCKISTPYSLFAGMLWALGNHNNPDMKTTETFSITEAARITQKSYEKTKSEVPELVEKLNKLLKR